MKKLLTVLAILGLGIAVAGAEGGLGLSYVYWDAEDGDDPGTGPGLKLQADLSEQAALELRAAYLENWTEDPEFEDMVLIPLEVDLVVRAALGEALTLFAGGGAGFYVLPEYESKVAVAGSEEPDVDPDDTWGYFAVAGLELALTESLSIFGEARYTWLEVDSVVIDVIDGEEIDTTADFTGAGFAGGIVLRW